MSGGSYDYLSVKCVDGLVASKMHLETVTEMAERLAKLGYPKAAAHTQHVISSVQALSEDIEMQLGRLNEVWHAVEWFDSCDWGEERTRRVLDEYEAGAAEPSHELAGLCKMHELVLQAEDVYKRLLI